MSAGLEKASCYHAKAFVVAWLWRRHGDEGVTDHRGCPSEDVMRRTFEAAERDFLSDAADGPYTGPCPAAAASASSSSPAAGPPAGAKPAEDAHKAAVATAEAKIPHPAKGRGRRGGGAGRGGGRGRGRKS